MFVCIIEARFFIGRFSRDKDDERDEFKIYFADFELGNLGNLTGPNFFVERDKFLAGISPYSVVNLGASLSF